MAIDFRRDRGTQRADLGRAQIDIGRNKGPGSIGLTNKDKLAISKTGTANLVRGIMERNLRREKEAKQKQRNKMTGSGLRSFDGGNRLMASELDDEIAELTRRIHEAANGKPAKVSITGQRDKQKSLVQFIKGLFAAQAQEGNKRSGSPQRVNSSEGSSGTKTSSSSAGERVLTDLDVETIVKAFGDDNPRNKGQLSAKAE